MNLLDHVRMCVLDALTAELGAPPANAGAITVSAPSRPEHGDLATNAAMVCAKAAGMKPRDLAERLQARLADHPDIARVAVAGPGFLNLSLTDRLWAALVDAIRSAGPRYGHTDALADAGPVNVEYVSANPTGPVTVGHARGAVVGDVLANLLAACGQTVTREYYVNDAGSQIDDLVASVRLRMAELDGVAIGSIPEGLYPGEYVIEIARTIRERTPPGVCRTNAEIRDMAVELMMTRIRTDLAALGVHHDAFTSERTTVADGWLSRALDRLGAAGLVYRGTLPPPKNADPETWVAEEQTLFHSSAYGDDVDRALLRPDGTPTYFAGDAAYHHAKIDRGFTRLLNVMGVDHAGYVTRMRAVVQALSEGAVTLEAPLTGLVTLLRDGQPVKMSKRAGEFVELAEVVAEVGADAVRFMMLTRKTETPLEFDLEAVKRQVRDNPLFYVQYAHARCCSLARKAEDAFPGLAVPGVTAEAVTQYASAADRALLKQVARFPQVVAEAAQSREPHRLAGYLQELASEVHQHWTAGNDDPQARIIVPGAPDLTAFRLALIEATRTTLAGGLTLIGITPLDRMTADDAPTKETELCN